MRLQSMRLSRLALLARGNRLTLTVLLAVAVPALVAITAITTLADSSPSPSGSPAALPGDPTKGAATYAANCTSCHGASMAGGIGPALNPIASLPGVPDSLDVTFLITTITNGRIHKAGDPVNTDMPAKGGNLNLTDQDVKDLASYIIQQNRIPGGGNYPANVLAERTMLWVGIGIVAMLFITLLLAQYNMRWIARRAAARRK